MSKTKPLKSKRLTLIAATLEHIRVELEAPGNLAGLLNAQVSNAWPTGEYDRDAMEFFRSCFEQGGEAVEGWYGWYAVRDAEADTPRLLVGSGGYSVLPEWQRRGYASEKLESLVKHAFTFGSTQQVIAHTTDANPASIAVLSRCGFKAAGIGREGALRFELQRPAGVPGKAVINERVRQWQFTNPTETD